jgi:hypothetical protein
MSANSHKAFHCSKVHIFHDKKQHVYYVRFEVPAARELQWLSSGLRRRVDLDEGSDISEEHKLNTFIFEAEAPEDGSSKFLRNVGTNL